MLIYVRAKAGAKKEFIKQIDKTHFSVAVNARPENGKANMAIAKALARHFKIAPSRIRLIRGASARQKIFEIPHT